MRSEYRLPYRLSNSCSLVLSLVNDWRIDFIFLLMLRQGGEIEQLYMPALISLNVTISFLISFALDMTCFFSSFEINVMKDSSTASRIAVIEK